jgi:hypothetical protein
VYKNIWNAIRAFESEYFVERVPMTPVKYISQKIVTYNPFTDLSIRSKEGIGGVGFFRNNTQNKIDVEKVLHCDRSSLVYFSHECRTMRKESLLESLTYPVLTK